MGYYTTYTLKTEPAVPGLIDQLKSRCHAANFALTSDGESNDTCKWYEHEEDMRAFSGEHPDVLFILSGYGEQSTDIWIDYYKGGKCQSEEAKITSAPFDPAKLT